MSFLDRAQTERLINEADAALENGDIQAVAAAISKLYDLFEAVKPGNSIVIPPVPKQNEP
jgi:hypothetical protein